MSGSAARALAGAIGGAAAMACTYPLSNASMRLQTQTHEEALAHGGESALATLVRMAREEGVGSWYAGLESALAGTFATEGIFYLWLSLARARWRAAYGLDELSPAANVLVSCQAAVISVFFTTPIWVINARLVTARRKNEHLSLGQLYASEGLSGLYRGLGASLVLCSNPVITHSVYENIKAVLVPASSGLVLSDAQRFVLAAFAKLVATVLTYPLVLVKSRMQQTSRPASEAPAASDMLSMVRAPFAEAWHAVCAVYASEGFAGYFRGLQAKMLQSVLRNAFLFAFESRVMRLILQLVAFGRSDASPGR